jgi:hypothetical protein
MEETEGIYVVTELAKVLDSALLIPFKAIYRSHNLCLGPDSLL